MEGGNEEDGSGDVGLSTKMKKKITLWLCVCSEMAGGLQWEVLFFFAFFFNGQFSLRYLTFLEGLEYNQIIPLRI